MQPVSRDACAVEIEPRVDDRTESADSFASGLRRWIDDSLDWLDRYWDDPELRTGFWNSGW